MFDIKEFCHRINPDRPNIFEQLRNNQIINPAAESIEDLDEKDRDRYEKETKVYLSKYESVWRDIVHKYFKYKKPNLVNATNKQMLDSGKLYVHACFMRSGKNNYLIQHDDTNYLGSCMVKHRQEEVAVFKKKVKKLIIERTFVKEKSVFASWREDTKKVINACLEHDARYWKLHKFVPQASARADVLEIVRKHFLMLKATHLKEAANSTYPSTFITEYMAFAKKCDLFHPKLMSYIDMERTFITVNFEVEN